MSSYNRSFYGKLLFRRWSTLNPMETNQIGLLGRVAKILLKKLNSTPNALHFRSDFAQRSPTLARPFLARSSFVFVSFFFPFSASLGFGCVGRAPKRPRPFHFSSPSDWSSAAR